MCKKIIELNEFEKINVDFTYKNRKELFEIIFEFKNTHERLLQLFLEVEEKEKEKYKKRIDNEIG